MYTCLSQNYFENEEGYQLVPIRKEDIESIRLWRNAQIDVLRQQTIIESDAQQSYFKQMIWPLFEQAQPSQIIFSFLYKQTCIGYGGLTHVDWASRRAEVSFLVDPERAENVDLYRNDFMHFLRFLFKVAFQTLQFHRLHGETFAFRELQIQILEQCGFKREGILREHIYKKGQWHDSVLHGLLASEVSDAK